MEKKLIKKLLKATGVKEGELILLHFWGEDKDKQILHDFATQVAALGATPFEVTQSRTVNRELFSGAKDCCFNERYFQIFKEFDAVIDLFAYQPVVIGSGLSEQAMQNYRRYMSGLFGTLMKAKRFTQLRIPTEENAKEFNMVPQVFIEQMTNAYDVDYDNIRLHGEEKIEQLKKTKKAILYTGEKEILTLEYENRDWHIDAGDGDLPCGEIYIAPLEDKTEGTMYFEILYLDDLPACEQVTLTIKEGKIVDSSHDMIKNYLMELPENGCVVCEFGIGLNPKIKGLTGCTVLDEKMEGTVHIAIGANHMFGGVNEAPMHIDLVGVATIDYE
ncbi:aminopeptidase [Lachnoclostridium phytofermentans]|uniref:Leucyl aminopeptidase (Aminopeptidase T)-like protein n=1 Tax=Lachnoclostridium phytofermentans (strain ATCC 700394 / DSM 18823 / ISDg) TaxID=357809 RepID=A9KRM4_LACP7|nr:aminopeptidase [Lachnoclostridium phytofermentans]ABX43518.1 Leucyl aminopeptidase (aminopeptidase T)-like protein [Lachnoclostridium phytofermentans ISDg]